MAIISLSGRKGSGKDLVGNIIRYLTTKWSSSEHAKQDIEANFKLWLQENNQSDWQIKKFADKLKDMVCLLIGCTREQLEDQEFKEAELGKEWIRFPVKIYWSNDIITKDYFYDSVQAEDYKELIESEGTGTVKVLPPENLTPRLILQLLGTDCVRNIIHPQAWVNATFADYIPTINRVEVPQRAAGFIDSIPQYPNWIITDMRFPNELKAVKDRGGISIRVNRLKYDPLKTYTSKGLGLEGNQWYSGTELNMRNSIGLHESETALDNAEFDYVINNNGTISELINQVKTILIDLKLLEDE